MIPDIFHIVGQYFSYLYIIHFVLKLRNEEWQYLTFWPLTIYLAGVLFVLTKKKRGRI